MGEGRGNGKLQDGNLHITSFPWTTNEQQNLHSLTDENPKN